MADGRDDPRYGRRPPERYYGKYAGLVIANGPPDAGGHRGEVTVQIPGILEETPDGSASRPMQVRAAPAFLPGYFFVPDEQAAVWVEFVAGDINHPIWTGVWYPQDGTPAAAGGAAPTLDQKIIRTRSGKVIQLDDTGGSEKLVISDETSKSTITFDKSGITIVAQGGIALSYQPSGGTAATLTLDDQGIVATCGGSSLTVSDSQIALHRAAVSLTVTSTVDVS